MDGVQLAITVYGSQWSLYASKWTRMRPKSTWRR